MSDRLIEMAKEHYVEQGVLTLDMAAKLFEEGYDVDALERMWDRELRERSASRITSLTHLRESDDA